MEGLINELNGIEKEAAALLENVKSPDDLETIRVRFLGRKSRISQILSDLASLPKDQRGLVGRQCNELKNRLSNLFETAQAKTAQPGKKDMEMIDVTMPAIMPSIGNIHPITQIMNEIFDIFVRLGFGVVSGPEIETEYYNFEALNIPKGHPSRQTFDTFYLGMQPHKEQGKFLLRSQTSTVQIRIMEKEKPPLRIVSGGRVYRPDATDASHSFMFHQIEGFMVDKDVRFSHLKAVLTEFLKQLFSEDIDMRFRPHFFPFTEPSVEVDISCMICRPAKGKEYIADSKGQRAESEEERIDKKRCSVCGGKGWLEILGAGLIHPNVFKAVGIDEKKFSGFAFGMGVERIAMLKFGISDIRLFFENDARFLKQF